MRSFRAGTLLPALVLVVCDAKNRNMSACDMSASEAISFSAKDAIKLRSEVELPRGLRDSPGAVPTRYQCMVELPRQPGIPAGIVRFYQDPRNHVHPPFQNVSFNTTWCTGPAQWEWGPTVGQACQPYAL